MRQLADAERALGEVPDGSAWLDDRTVDDLDLPIVFRAVDRTTTPTGAQVLWRWLVAPATRNDVLDARERKLAALATRDVALRPTPSADAPYLPQLLWHPAPALGRTTFATVVTAILLACAAIAPWWSGAIAVLVFVAAIAAVIDVVAHQKLADHAYALDVLGRSLAEIARIAPAVPAELGDVADDLAAVRTLRARIALLSLSDPFGVIDLVRTALMVRSWTLRSCLRLVDTERARLRRLVLWLGEVDALTAIARLRAERSDARIPQFVDGAPQLEARDVVHPAIERAIGNDVALASSGLLVTGSNASGKSTLLRALGINAILAQSLHTTFGTWRASLVRVRAVMRIVDDLASGKSTYAVEVAAVGELVAAVRGTLPTLCVLDEPFHGTNPAVRVPIVVAVLEYLVAHDLVVAATHDLDVARLLGPELARVHFIDTGSGTFDRKLRDGIAPSTNAVELLANAGFPAQILDRVRGSLPRHDARA